MLSRIRAGWMPVALLAGVLLATNAGCAGAGLRRQQAIETEAIAHIYHRPAPDVAAEVRRLLSDTGFSLTPDSDDTFVRTQWKAVIEDDEVASLYERYVIRVKRLTPHYSRVVAMKVSLTTVGMETYHPLRLSQRGARNGGGSGKGLWPLPMGPPVLSRDGAFEWALLERVEETNAQRIEASIR